jgi:hypothetical protein
MSLILGKILSSLMSNTTDFGVPDHEIASYDSRLWDPEWKRRYGADYGGLHRVLTYALKGNSAKAATMASRESFWWGGRGGRPNWHLQNFYNTPEQVQENINRWWDKVLNMWSEITDIDGIGVIVRRARDVTLPFTLDRRKSAAKIIINRGLRPKIREMRGVFRRPSSPTRPPSPMPQMF